MSYLEGEYHEATSEYAGEKSVLRASLPVDPAVRNFSFTVVDDAICFQENSRMYLQDITGKKAERIQGMVEITHAVRVLIDFQNRQPGNLPTAEYEAELRQYIGRLNTVYDRFVKEYGYLNSYGNVIAFSRDANAPLLRSIERESKTEKGVFEKSAMFYKATIKPKVMPKAVFSAEKALKVCLNTKGRLDLEYMSWLYQKPDGHKATPEEIIDELGNAIYQDPDRYTGSPLTGWQTAGEYLSGYVKDKLTAAILKRRKNRNVEALRAVQLEPLTPQDISFSLGTPWIPLDVYQDFMYETFQTAEPNRSGYQMKNRFAQFHNLPELMSMFSMVADIKTADMLDLPTPTLKTGGVQVVKTSCTPDQKRIVMELAERAENIRDGNVDSSEDNFLKLIHEARLLDPDLPDDPDTKLNVCARKVARIYHDTADKRLTQLIFCDQGTPKYDGTFNFNFYEATKEALIKQGVKPDEIAFIHDAKTDVQRRPADLTQRNGRILRQGNDNSKVSVFNYITENTFDAYLWQILEQKQRYISQIMTSRSALRTCEDLDETVLQYAEFKAMATSDPRIREKMEVDNEISRLTVLKSVWQSQHNELQRNISKHYPDEITKKERMIQGIDADLAVYAKQKPAEFQMVIDGKLHEERTKAAEHFMVLGRDLGDTLEMGSYAGFTVRLVRQWSSGTGIQLCGKCTYTTDMGDSELGNITRIENLAERMAERLADSQKDLEDLNRQLAAAKAECEKTFADAEKLAELQKRKVSLDLALEFKEDGDDMIAGDEAEGETPTADRLTMADTVLTLEQRLYQKLAVFAAPVLDGSS